MAWDEVTVSRFRTRNSGVWVPVRSALSAWDPHNWALPGKPWDFFGGATYRFYWLEKRTVLLQKFGLGFGTQWTTYLHFASHAVDTSLEIQERCRYEKLVPFFLCRTNPSITNKNASFSLLSLGEETQKLNNKSSLFFTAIFGTLNFYKYVYNYQ